MVSQIHKPSTIRDPRLITFARSNRSQMSDAERRLWTYLRSQHLGIRFRRQHPISPYIADFACVSLRLVVEVDGSQHRGSGYDVERDIRMKLKGWTVVRVWAWDVIRDIEGTVGTIMGVIEELTDR